MNILYEELLFKPHELVVCLEKNIFLVFPLEIMGQGNSEAVESKTSEGWLKTS